MTTGHRILMISNESVLGGEAGFRDALYRYADQGLLDEVMVAAPRVELLAGAPWSVIFEKMKREVKDFSPSVVIILSPKATPWTPKQVEEIARDSTVIYWEGDPWRSRYNFTNSMKAWASRADCVYSVAGGVQSDALWHCGAKDVRLTLHTYCHVQNAQFMDWTPRPQVHQNKTDVVVVANRQKLFRVKRPVPGAVARAAAIGYLQRTKMLDLAVYGLNWTGPGARGVVGYDRQIPIIREALISANWDHYPHHFGYSSDRLPISMLAGRVHVTTSHPGTDWLQELDGAVVRVSSPLLLRDEVELAFSQGEKQLIEKGRFANQWTRGRLSDLEGMRHMLYRFVSSIAAPPSQPWDRLPTLSKPRRVRGNSER